MGRPRINKSLPAYVSEYRDRHGKGRLRFRRTGWKTFYPTAKPGTPEFTEEYFNWKEHGQIRVGEDRIEPGTFDDLIVRFYRSTNWTNIKPTTQNTYRGELERFRAKFGNRRVSTMTARHVANLMAQMAETPSAANNLKKRLNQLFNFAIVIGMRKDNPALPIRSLKTRSGGFQTWQEEQIIAFEEVHPLGTMPRLAFDLALYTAQRRSDIRPMGPKDIERGKIRVRQLKTGKSLLIPVHLRLAQSIAATVGHPDVFLTTAHGNPFTSDASFGNWFSKQCAAAGLKGYSMHGLRKSASRRMAEMGLSNQLIKAITGHSSDAEVSRYTRDAEQELMAEKAMSIMNLANPKK